MEAIENINIIPRYGGNIIHDSWSSNMKTLLLETCRKVSKRKKKQLTGKGYSHLQKRCRNILTRGEKELPTIPPKPNGKRGKTAKSNAHNLWERLRDHESAVLLFAKNSCEVYSSIKPSSLIFIQSQKTQNSAAIPPFLLNHKNQS